MATINITELTNGIELNVFPGKKIFFPFFSFAKIYAKKKINGSGDEVILQTHLDETITLDYDRVETPVTADAEALALVLLDYDRKS